MAGPFTHYYRVHGWHQTINRFSQKCHTIENDSNYRPNITNQDLMGLVCDADGNSIYTPRKSALAIKRSAIKNNDGRVYDILIARKSPLEDGDDIPVWHIDDSVVCLVHKSGYVTFHPTFFKDNVQHADFDRSLKHLNLDQFLNQECLHQDKPTFCVII